MMPPSNNDDASYIESAKAALRAADQLGVHLGAQIGSATNGKRAESASEIRPCKAIRLTEKDLKRLDDGIEKIILRLAERFGDCDGGIERMLDDFLADSRRWADELREYMKERTADGETWEL